MEELQIQVDEDRDDGAEERQLQADAVLCDDEHYQAEVEEHQLLEQPSQQEHINNITASNNNDINDKVANINAIDNAATKCEQKQQEEEQQQQMQMQMQMQVQQHCNQLQTDDKSCKMIFKRAEDFMADDSDDYVIRLQQKRKHQQTQQYHHQKSYVIDYNGDDMSLKQNCNSSLVTAETTNDCQPNSNPRQSRAKHKTCTLDDSR